MNPIEYRAELCLNITNDNNSLDLGLAMELITTG